MNYEEPTCKACEWPLESEKCHGCAGTGISDSYGYARHGSYCRNCHGNGREYYCTNQKCKEVNRVCVMISSQ